MTISSQFQGATFRQAKYYRRGRAGKVLWIVIHSAEAKELPATAEALGGYFASPDRVVSAHYSVDCDSVVQHVLEGDTAFACGPANDSSINIELAGYASQTAKDWDDCYSRQELDLLERLIVDILSRHAIPIYRPGNEEVYNLAPGIIGHDTITFVSRLAQSKTVKRWPWLAEHRTFHTDPGPGFPWARVLTGVAARVG